MTNPPRGKGTRAETAAAAYLTGVLGFDVTRGPLRGNADRGDLFGVPDWTLEVKNTKTPQLLAWRRELAAEQRNTGTRRGAVLWSPPGVGMGRVARWVVFEWDRHAPGDRHVVPHLGHLNNLHRYVEAMQAWGYTTLLFAGNRWVSARWVESWLTDVVDGIVGGAA